MPGRIVFTTSFGIEDQAITHLIFTRGLDIEVVTLDTGRLFPVDLRALGRRPRSATACASAPTIPTRAALAALVADAGINGFYHSKAARLDCCCVRKVEPLDRALAGAARLGDRAARRPVRRARQRSSSPAGTRSAALIKVAPLFDWTREQVAAFCAAEQVPVNALHARASPRSAASPAPARCSRARRSGPAAGGGRQDEARECGLHVDADGRLVRSRAA